MRSPPRVPRRTETGHDRGRDGALPRAGLTFVNTPWLADVVRRFGLNAS